jgi:uncharacterized protein YegP (UPF0339 family)
MPGWYELSSTSNDKHAFVLKAANAEIILNSEHYVAKASAQNGIASVQTHSVDDAMYELKTAKDGRHYFNLKAANGQVVGTSQMYTTETARVVGMASVQTNGPSPDIREA